MAVRCEDHVAHYECESCLKIHHDYTEAEECCDVKEVENES